MAQKTIIGALNGFFNSGDGVSLPHGGEDNFHPGGVPVKRGVAAFRDELKALTDTEKRELAEEVVALTGDTLAAK